MVKFGMEIEFLSYDDYGDLYDPDFYQLYDGWLHAREYYHGMQELISPPRKFTRENVYRTIREGVMIIKKTSYESRCKSLLYSKPIYKYSGILSAGIHIHLSFTRNEGCLLTKIYDYVPWEIMYKIVKEYENIFGWGIRSKLSHHIWGGFRNYEYNFKKNPRFKPVIISPKKARKPKTIEIRLLDVEDILHPEKVYVFIKQCIKIIKSNLQTDENYKELLYKEYVYKYDDLDTENGYDNVKEIIKEEGLSKNKKLFMFVRGELRRDV